MNTAKARIAREAIRAHQTTIEGAQGEIERIAKEAIPDFHFLDHKVSTFWTCDASPIGVCVWDVSERGYHVHVCCRYCGLPTQRK